MGHIKNIEIKNFKSIRHAKIEDCRQVNVFIGYPNVGKSNILEALGGYSLLNKKAFQTKSLKSLIRFTRFTDIFFNGDAGKPATIEVNQEDNLIYSLSDLESLNLFISGLGDETKQKGSSVGVRGGLMYLKSRVNKDGSFLFSEGIDVENTGKVLIKKYLFESGGKFESSKSLNLSIPNGDNLNDIVELNSELRKEFNEILKEYGLNLHFNRTESGNKLELRKSLPDGTTITLDWNLIADTLQRLFFFKAAILSNQNSVLLFEEPEAHMFPAYISKLTADVMYEENNNQFFMTTHSPFVLNDFMENLKSEELAIYVVGYKKELGETVVRKLKEKEIHEIYQYGIDLYFNLENYLVNEQQ